jgi:hypothetical protein
MLLPFSFPRIFMFEQDLDWLITGWDEGVGMGIEIFIRFHWMKNMRMDDSLLSVSVFHE